MWLTVIPSVPRAFCLIAMAMRFFSARVSLRAASIFGLTSACSLSASRRFSAKVPIPSSLDTCSSLCKLVIESVPISIYKRRIDDLCLYRDTAWNKNKIKNSYKSVTCVGGCRVARPRSSLRINGSAGRARNFFQTSASRLQNMIYSLGNHFKTAMFLDNISCCLIYFISSKIFILYCINEIIWINNLFIELINIKQSYT